MLTISLAGGDVSASSSLQSNSSKPIAIELPAISRNKISSAPVYTPPEPLSARGDLPGGYFPLHEDPNGRVHHPHPFHHDSKLARHKSITLAAENSPLDGRKPPATTSASIPTARATTNMPVASYLPSGFHDTPLPMGKYYPSNYEQRNRDPRSSRPSFSESAAPTKSSPQLPHAPLSSSNKPPEDEVRRRMIQYQRDMVAQARLALSSSATCSSKSNPSLQGLPIKELRFLATSPHKPASPKLVPLGSPGPVTPMELESGSGSYLDKGERIGDSLAPPGIGFVARASR
ncbi:hypothetical protein B0I35DRAFT_97925 [Stachybotrys elegans]|uniref:Uncharacterized protein n=1 Tax=Stachybotrys elegans TaxID=80388 RepID=A0A8K0SKW0_9HYPO|nr:hypothetical protein B0I35DRAFT_97925 [Stachybotrys elegans]